MIGEAVVMVEFKNLIQYLYGLNKENLKTFARLIELGAYTLFFSTQIRWNNHYKRAVGFINVNSLVSD